MVNGPVNLMVLLTITGHLKILVDFPEVSCFIDDFKQGDMNGNASGN